MSINTFISPVRFQGLYKSPTRLSEKQQTDFLLAAQQKKLEAVLHQDKKRMLIFTDQDIQNPEAKRLKELVTFLKQGDEDVNAIESTKDRIKAIFEELYAKALQVPDFILFKKPELPVQKRKPE
jgi:hypothetical protein